MYKDPKVLRLKGLVHQLYGKFGASLRYINMRYQNMKECTEICGRYRYYRKFTKIAEMTINSQKDYTE